jgi:hypothetical protein
LLVPSFLSLDFLFVSSFIPIFNFSLCLCFIFHSYL